MALVLTKENFEEEVMNSNIPVLVDFWASWCGPCKMIGPIIEELHDELKGKVKVGKVNVDEQGDLAAEHSVMSIPTLALFKDKKLLFIEAGARDKKSIISMIENEGISL